MSTMPWDRYAAQAQAPTQGAAQMPWEKYPSGGSAAPQQDFSRLTANPKGEGTYQISTPDAQKLDVPYSNVDSLIGLHGFNFSSPDEQNRFAKDAGVDPNSVHSSAARKFLSGLIDPVGTGGAEQGVVGGIRQVGGQAIATAAQPALHPIKTLEGAAKTAAYAGGTALGVPMPEAWNPVTPVVEGFMRDKQQGGVPLAAENLAGQVLGTVEGGRVAGAAVSGVEPSPALGPAGEAPPPGAAGPVNTVGGANRLMPEAVRNGSLPSAWNWAAPKVGAPVRTAIAGDVNAPIAGTDLTPAERYASMQRMGVHPDAAQATESAPMNIAEKVNQNSLTAAPAYTAARASNMAALNRFTDRLLDGMSPVGPEEGGAAVQQGLRDAQTKLQNNAAEGFSELDRAVGNRRMSGLTIQQTAKNIYDANADYYAQHPSLVPGNAWKIVKDLAGADTTPAFASRPMSFPEVHQLRSDLLEMVRTNPDIVKNQAGGWLQQLADAADKTMTTDATGLSPQGTQIFRNANEAWANMKGTYDNPSHPFYSAVRTPSPSTLVNGTAGIAKTPEMANMLQSALGPDGMGPIQRGAAQNLLGTTKEGTYNFKNFQGRWNKMPEATRNALFTPEQQQQLEDIGNAGTVLNEDLNYSGSAKLGQGIAEGAEALRSVTSPHEMVGNAAYHAGQYALSKLMNSPTFVDWLMRDRAMPVAARTASQSPTAVNRLIPAAVASGAMSSSWDWDKNQPKQ